ncbi:uncharacterized protein K02A2.6-like [Aplysia californica]|uniref:Uncharacterized protein K02A2.6-like n=1 Tax=Aplysia californica TaxID=6500 RepID=A0ABM1A522_APLCA|nr:uncharacterized protein K02A2.6-like [Aplysia californica]
MTYFDPNLLTEITVDASPFGLGCILSQRDNNNVHIVAYASRALTDVESRYSQTEREALAVVWACEHFNLYLLGQHFTVISDHKPLEGIFNSTTSRTSARIERWNLRLQPYDFTLRYQPGENNPDDFLSRHPFEKNNMTSFHMAKIADDYVNFMAGHSVPKAMTLEEIASASESDPTLQAVITSVQTDHWHTLPEITVDAASYQVFKTVREELSVHKDGTILLRGTQIVIPRSLQQHVINIAHEGHQGIVKTKQLLREKVWFPHIDRQVENTVKSCLACLSTIPEHHSEPQRMTPLPTKPWSEVSIDFCGPFPSGDYLLVVIDDYSRFPEVEILSSTSARATIPKLDSIFARHGVPHTVKSDNGPPFSSYEFKQFASQLGCKHRRITPLWPQANGGVERCMRMLKKTVQSAHIEGKPWKQELYHFLRNYRATPHISTGVSPAEALFKRNIRVKLPQIDSLMIPPTTDNDIHQHDTNKKGAAKRYADDRRHAQNSDIQVGDTVLARQPYKNKLSSFYDHDPYQVTSKKGPMVTASRNGKNMTRNTSFFKRVPDTLKSSNPTNSTEEEEEDEDNKASNETADSQNPTTTNEPIATERPQRHRKRPGYLNDYVTNSTPFLVMVSDCGTFKMLNYHLRFLDTMLKDHKLESEIVESEVL